ncbi:MAG: hypothetical protein Q7S66_01030 [bacterium]|nr:hypothetical protein [bacterium]
MKSLENPSMEQQMEEFERGRHSEEEQALNQLLDELSRDPRKLTPVEIIFLKRQLDGIETALSRPHEDGVERDDLTIKSDTISKLLEEK